MAIHRLARFDLQQARQHHFIQFAGLHRVDGVADHVHKRLLRRQLRHAGQFRAVRRRPNAGHKGGAIEPAALLRNKQRRRLPGIERDGAAQQRFFDAGLTGLGKRLPYAALELAVQVGAVCGRQANAAETTGGGQAAERRGKEEARRRRKISGEPVFFALLHFLSIDVVHGSIHRFALKDLK